ISTFAINHFDLFGLRQVYLNFKGQEYTHLDFKKTGLYGMVRHPIMLGFVMAFWTVPTMTYASLFFAVMTTGYILVALQIEEGDLMKAHPDTYGQYRKEVSMLVPLPKGKS
ncbi:MAG: isoprenylcysteine carboxylmethyltransferase family protein, partial [Gemmatimonadota bacterium]|nr:isoprenylcysteine carboxylmethyltransferase family protein [Gemmatimonadota bacterium]